MDEGKGIFNHIEDVGNLDRRDVKLHGGKDFCLCGGDGVDGSSGNGDVDDTGGSGGFDDSGGSGVFRSNGGGLFKCGWHFRVGWSLCGGGGGSGTGAELCCEVSPVVFEWEG